MGDHRLPVSAVLRMHGRPYLGGALFRKPSGEERPAFIFMDSASSSIVYEGGSPVDCSRPIAVEIPLHLCYPEVGGIYYQGDVMGLARDLRFRYRAGRQSAPMPSGFGGPFQHVEDVRQSSFLGSFSMDMPGPNEPQGGSRDHAHDYAPESSSTWADFLRGEIVNIGGGQVLFHERKSRFLELRHHMANTPVTRWLKDIVSTKFLKVIRSKYPEAPNVDVKVSISDCRSVWTDPAFIDEFNGRLFS